MRQFIKILKWTGVILLIMIAALSITVMARQNVKYNAPVPSIKSSADTTITHCGQQLVFGSAHCAGCHSKVNAGSLLELENDVALSGGYEFRLPVRNSYSKNITPDPAAGIALLLFKNF